MILSSFCAILALSISKKEQVMNKLLRLSLLMLLSLTLLTVACAAETGTVSFRSLGEGSG